MKRHSTKRDLPRAQALAERAFASIERFLHIEAVSGIVLLMAAAIALIWVNSPLADSYQNVWHAPFSIGLGTFEFSRSLHFWINDALMTFFFLVVGMEIRREIHEGSLNNIRQAMLPMIAALGGAVVPALIFLGFNSQPIQQNGWAIPTATDIAFAVGVLALLGRSIPGNIRIFLLTLAIIDDIIAVLIIALFYSGGLNYAGFLIAGLGIMLVLGFQRIGIGSAFGYIIPGAIIWIGMLMTGAHPTLAGVVLGLMTPVVSVRMSERPLDILSRIANELTGQDIKMEDEHKLAHSLRKLQLAQRELLPPVVRVQKALHPWVAYGVMPLFALANAGVSMSSGTFAAENELRIIIGVVIALVIGKPLGIIGMSWVSVKMRWCQLSPDVNWKGIALVGLLAGIGFTMSIFIAMLAFADESLLNAAKLGVLLGSLTAAVLGLAWGKIYIKQMT
ncbi:Na+/H+ antiporter NhaA [Legionella shakespearei]|uniref:Na(+)/H(+) antiporter NhaA n=1 Tax=Legionella shakespearei DSM 23087 TaxID=1122169 RepID=A0A0W0ZF78_9GAMM|nr:Na+/H+ antiporter NhaA [Legionella shakespearei]KTD67566.1 pH-dependent sodium/proton antiporter [Legionella shakespearei DSM 23087]